MKYLKTSIGLAISIACLYLVIRQVNVSELRTAFARFEWPYAAIGLASLAFGYIIRIVRWASLLDSVTTRRIGFSECWAPFMGSITLNNILPLRAGDFVRSVVFPRSMGVDMAAATGSVVMERIIDLLTLLIGLFVCLSLLKGAEIPVSLARIAPILGGVCGLTLLIITFGGGAISDVLVWIRRLPRLQSIQSVQKVFNFAERLVSDMARMSQPVLIVKTFLMSAVVWIAEAGLFHFILVGFGVDVGYAAAFFVMVLGTLATLVPSSPGYFGTFHLAAVAGMAVLKISPGTAVSIAVILHLFLWGATSIIGGSALMLKPQLFLKRTSNAKIDTKKDT